MTSWHHFYAVNQNRFAQVSASQSSWVAMRGAFEVMLAAFFSTENEKNESLEKIFGKMKELLVHDLDIERFADMYAQTLVYGLFVRQYNDTSLDDFTRHEAQQNIPRSNPFLRHFFDHIAGIDFSTNVSLWSWMNYVLFLL